MLREILRVFTKEYREETKCIELQRSMIGRLRLRDNAGSVDDKIVVLRDAGYISDFRVDVGEYA